MKTYRYTDDATGREVARRLHGRVQFEVDHDQAVAILTIALALGDEISNRNDVESALRDYAYSYGASGIETAYESAAEYVEAGAVDPETAETLVSAYYPNLRGQA